LYFPKYYSKSQNLKKKLPAVQCKALDALECAGDNIQICLVHDLKKKKSEGEREKNKRNENEKKT
jgi:hypothetical protein